MILLVAYYNLYFKFQDTVSSLQLKISEAEKARQEYLVNGKLPDTKPKKVITKVILGSQTKRRTKDKPTESHVAGQRVRYFPDDDKHSLKSMVRINALFCVHFCSGIFVGLYF